MALPRHFGQRLLTFEGAVYDFMRRFAADYDGVLAVLRAQQWS